MVGVVVYALYKVWKVGKKEFVIVAGNLCLPVIFLAAIGIFFPVYSFRYVSYLMPLFMLMVARGLMEIKNTKLRYLAIIGITVIWFIIINVYWSVFTDYKWGFEFAI